MDTTRIAVGEYVTMPSGRRVQVKKIIHFYGKVRRSWPYHRHDYWEVSFTFRGSTILRLNGQDYEFKDGDICLVAPDTIHGNALTGDREYLRVEDDDDVWSLQLNPDMFSGLPGDMWNHRREAWIIPMGDYAPYIRRSLKILMERQKKQVGLDPLSHSLMVLLIQLVLELQEAEGIDRRGIKDQSDEYTREILNYINDHYRENISLEMLTRRFAISKSQLSRNFQQNFAISPINHRLAMQISDACTMLTEGSMTAFEIADVLGFENQSYFRKYFQQKMGLPPQAFRRQYAVHYLTGEKE